MPQTCKGKIEVRKIHTALNKAYQSMQEISERTAL